MLDVFNIAKPQGCDIQIFPGVKSAGANPMQYSWVKPRGVSNIYMMLIGPGGDGSAGTGGGSGVVTVWYGSAIHVPDNLIIVSATSGNPTLINYRTTSGAAITLLSAASGNGGATGGSGGGSMTANQFAASGYFQSIAGQNTTTSASATTFLSAGALGAITANYGYSTALSGSFLMQPIIVGIGGSSTGIGGIGCGGGGSNGAGGPGMVLIASW